MIKEHAKFAVKVALTLVAIFAVANFFGVTRFVLWPYYNFTGSKTGDYPPAPGS